MRTFRVLVDRYGETASLALAGEFDMAEVDAFEDELRQVEAVRPALVVLDLSELTLIDSHGLSALLDADARARNEGRRLVLVPPGDPVMQVFRITLLDRRFEWIEPGATLERDLAAALASLRARVAGR